MIARIWHGYTSRENAPVYENILKNEILPGIEKENIAGFSGIQLLKRDLGDETEFTTIMWFENIEAIKKFAGEDYETAHVPQRSKDVLLRYDSKSAHSELRHDSFR